MSTLFFVKLLAALLFANGAVFLVICLRGLARYYRATQTIDPNATGEEARPLLDVSPLKHLFISSLSVAIASFMLAQSFAMFPISFICLAIWLYARKNLEE